MGCRLLCPQSLRLLQAGVAAAEALGTPTDGEHPDLFPLLLGTTCWKGHRTAPRCTPICGAQISWETQGNGDIYTVH